MLTTAYPNLFSSASSTQFLSVPSHRPQTLKTPKTKAIITCSSSSMTDPLTSLGRLLWGPSLPPTLLVSAARAAWTSTWQLMMRQLAPSSSAGSYSRPASQFPSVPADYYSGGGPRRLRLYAAHACPWAHRALIVLSLSGLCDAGVSLSIATPSLDGPWEVSNQDGRVRLLKDVYRRRRGGYEGRATVPMLWDEEREEVVCNESYGIIEFFNDIGMSSKGMDLKPEGLREEIQRWNGIIYPNVNNGVYRCGFAQSQEAYDTAANDLFTTLDKLEFHLASSRFLCGETLTLADICLFTTLIRFDLVYNVLFKCTKKKLIEYPNLHAYTRDIYQIPKVAETCNFDAIMDGYYRVLFPLNPGSIRPVVPDVCKHEFLSRPHDRELLSSSSKQGQVYAV